MARPVSVSLFAPGGVDCPRNAEVGHPRVAAREHDVLGLDVAVNDPAGMGIPQRLGDLVRHLEGVVERQLLLALHAVTERLPRDVGHDVVQQPPARVAGRLDHAAVEEGEDVRMVELGGDGDLAEEPLGAERVGEFRVEDLDRHRAIVLEVVREVDGGHAALAELALDAVAVGEGGGESHQKIQLPPAVRGWSSVDRGQGVGKARCSWSYPNFDSTTARIPASVPESDVRFLLLTTGDSGSNVA